MLKQSKRLSLNRAQRWAGVILITVMILSSACSLPAPSPQPVPTPAPTTSIPQVTLAPTAISTADTPRPQPTAAPLPPALVEVDPAPQSEVGPKTAFTFYFNQAMERGSVQAALQAQPALTGSFQWVNDATVKFTPDQALPVNADLAVSFSTQARAANGLPLLAPADAVFRTAGGFSLVDRLPRPDTGDADPSSAVVATFTRPIVALGADPKSQPAAFSLEPASRGRGEWLNTSTYIFYPDPPLLGGIEYTVRLNPGLVAADGAGWAPEQKAGDWKFKTASPALLTVIPDPKAELALDAIFEITFNQPMDPASLQQNLLVKTPTGAPLAGKLTWNETGNRFTFTPDNLLARSGKYSLAISGKATARGGTALGKDFSAVYTTVPDFGVRSSNPANRGTIQLYDVNGGVRITFTAPLAKQDLTAKFVFQPPVGDMMISSYGEREVYVSGIFTPRSEYALTILSGIQDKWGQALKDPLTLRFQTAAPQPALSLAVSLSNSTAFILPRETALTGEATNLKTLRVSSAALSLAEFARNANVSAYERIQKYSGPALATFDKKLELTADRSNTIDIPLNAGGKPLAPGLYYYQIQSPEVNTKTNPNPNGMMLVVSRIHLTLKRSQNQLTIWAVNLESNQPLSGANLAVYTSDKNGILSQIGSLKSDEQGLARLDYAFPTDFYTPIYVVNAKPGDPDFSLAMTTWTQGVNGWQFGLNMDTRESMLHAYLYTDRPIYRPGQEVDFRVLVHQEDNGRYTPADLKQVTVKVYGAYDRITGERQVVFQGDLPLSEYGSAAGVFTLSDSASPGYYSLEVVGVGSSFLPFQVANYRKPEVELQVSLPASDLLAGKDISASVLAQYYFGAPAANLNLRWAAYAAPAWFPLPEGFQNGSLDNNWLMPYWLGAGMGSADVLVAEGGVRTAPDGRAAINISAQKWNERVTSPRTRQLTLQVTLSDEQELPVTQRATAWVHPAAFYLGLRADSWSGQAKREAGFTVQTFDWKKAPVAERKLSVLFQKVVYRQKADWNWQSNSSPYTVEYTKVASADLQVDAQGRGRIAFTPPDPGTYQVEVRGEGAVTQLLFWVGGAGRAPWPVLPDAHIRLVSDALEYQVGQTAKILIPNPLNDKAQALITVERGRVMRSEVVTINGSSLEYSLPLIEDYAPNVYLSVILVGTGSSGGPEFRAGYLNLPVAPRPFQLDVSVTVQPETGAPGGDLRLSLQVRDSQGKPVQGEFSLAVVDKAIFALADPNAAPILEGFYGKQPLGVNTSLSLAVYGHPRQVAADLAAGGRGGGGGDEGAVPVVRSEFRDTAYWNGRVVTDANGQAEVTLKLPDNLTTWVVTVRGLTRNMRVGEATREVVVSKSLLIRPQTPRFLVAGDRVLLTAVVNNNTSNAISAEVSLKASGVELENANEAARKVELSAQGRVQVAWWVKVQNVDQADLVFSVKGGGLDDASRPAGGSLPVRQYSVPQTFGTAGVLTEAGERLEVISAPRSFNPTAGELRLELSPSLAATVLDGIKSLDVFPAEDAEPVMSRLLPDLAAYRALQKLGIAAPEVRERLEKNLRSSVSRLVTWQNTNGGWGWLPDGESDPYLSAYLTFGLSEAKQAGVQIDEIIFKKAGDYLNSVLIAPATSTPVYQLDRLVFQYFALQQIERAPKIGDGLYNLRQRLSPWAQALLALTLNAQNASDARARTLLSDLQSLALRSASGAHWETKEGAQLNLGSPVFVTSVVSLALARLDPAAAVLNDAVRYLAANRRLNGCWASSYESAWALMALTEVMSASGELAANFSYAAELNGAPLASGKAGGPNGLAPARSQVPLSGLRLDRPNALTITHGSGSGRLYYRAFLQVYRPVEQAAALNRGLSVRRQIYLAGQDCTRQACTPVNQVRLSEQRELFVRLTLTLPQAMYHLVVEDYIPAGAEIVDNSLKTVKKNVTAPGKESEVAPYRLDDPFGSGWYWWLFGAPKVYDDHIRWVAAYLPAGTYELTYRLTPLQAGEFRLLPAHAYDAYFPEVEGTSAGAVFKIEP